MSDDLRFRFRQDTAAAWTAADPLLRAGEPGFETNTGRWKIGDGVESWTTLPYSVPLDVDGGAPDSVFGEITAIDGGTP